MMIIPVACSLAPIALGVAESPVNALVDNFFHRGGIDAEVHAQETIEAALPALPGPGPGPDEAQPQEPEAVA